MKHTITVPLINKRPRVTHDDSSMMISHATSGQGGNTVTEKSTLLRTFGISDVDELETLEAFLLNSVKFGSDQLKSGLANMFSGMQNAMEVYAQMTTEIHSLHEGIVAMKKEVTEAKEQGLIAETASIQEAEVNIFQFVICLIRIDLNTFTRINAKSPTLITTSHWWRLGDWRS
jgi:hypothetical protein